MKARVYWTLWLATLLIWGCGSKVTTTNGTNGGNSNWLRACNEDADCGDQDACISKVCLKPCDGSDACAGLNENAECRPIAPLELDDGDCTAAPEDDYCVLECEEDDDCEPMGSDYACSDGRCAPSCEAVGPAPATAEPEPEPAPSATPSEPEPTPSPIPNEPGSECDDATCIGGPCEPRVGCENDLVCVADSCDEQGVCAAPLNQACDDILQPMCACDGTEYDNACTAGNATIDHQGTCGDPCYSPQQNLELAYDGLTPGCECDETEAIDLCLPDNTGREVALTCVDGRWNAVDGGVCAMEPQCVVAVDAASCCYPFVAATRSEIFADDCLLNVDDVFLPTLLGEPNECLSEDACAGANCAAFEARPVYDVELDDEQECTLVESSCAPHAQSCAMFDCCPGLTCVDLVCRVVL